MKIQVTSKRKRKSMKIQVISYLQILVILIDSLKFTGNVGLSALHIML